MSAPQLKAVEPTSAGSKRMTGGVAEDMRGDDLDMRQRHFRRSLWITAGAAVVIVALWQSPKITETLSLHAMQADMLASGRSPGEVGCWAQMMGDGYFGTVRETCQRILVDAIERPTPKPEG